jgi:hypothetical protein
VQNIESGQTHGNDPNVRPVFTKALCCSAVVFLIIGSLGIALRRRRGRDSADS